MSDQEEEELLNQTLNEMNASCSPYIEQTLDLLKKKGSVERCLAVNYIKDSLNCLIDDIVTEVWKNE